MSKEKTQFTVRLTPSLRDLLDSFKTSYEESADDTIKSDKSLLEELVNTATAKYQPFKDNSDQVKKLEVQRDADMKTIEKLTNKLSLVTEKLNNQEVIINSYSNEKNELEKKSSNIFIKKSDVNEVSIALAKIYLKDAKTKKMFLDANSRGVGFSRQKTQEGTYNRFFDKIDTKNENENMKNLFTTTFLLSALGKTLPPVSTNANIIKAIKSKLNIVEL